jgi:hypothetical protein
MIHYEKSRGRLEVPYQFSPFEKLIDTYLEGGGPPPSEENT